LLDFAITVAICILALAVAWVVCYAHPATRPAALLLARPLSFLLTAAGVALAILVVIARPRRGRPADPPPGAPDHGAATGYAERIEADRADAESRRATREAIRRAVEARDPSILVERERKLREQAGLPPIRD
jgi:hypothetical protein